MAGKILKKVFGSKNDRELKRMRKLIKQINGLEETFGTLSGDDLRAKTADFKARYAGGETLEQLLPEAFAAVREASQRTLGLRHFDVQLIGGIALHEGKIAEMRTGEGKTLVATLAAYLNALAGEGVHIVTVNDYLARRDAEWMAPIYNFLDMQVGVIHSGQHPAEKARAYAADITYGTNNEYGFDYLRDNMTMRLEDKAQRSLFFAIVDEVDSILIDEARTPLIISGAAQNSSVLYKRINAMAQLLEPRAQEQAPRNGAIESAKVILAGTEEPVAISEALAEAEEKGRHLVQVDGGKFPICEFMAPGHFIIDEKSRQVELTEEGHQKIEGLMINEGLLQEDESLYQAANLGLLHHVNSALRAHHLFHKNVEYIAQNGSIVLIDEHTGRTMPGRRLSEGLHQAIEAKEGVDIQSESQTLASTTFQNYFRHYQKLAGMTGTADTEAYEFHQIYGLQVVVIPTNVKVMREDLNDLIYLTVEEKYDAVIADIRASLEKDAPVLVGTASIETSEEMSRRLQREGIGHQVLNAKFHEKEAHIIAQAGRPGTVTIATNMAGRGTDIVLGGSLEAETKALDNPSKEKVAEVKADWQERHDKVIAAGGLHILGTERHESRRIDNQLRGRAGRQGDPGVSRFYLSLDDQLMRLFASERVQNMMRALGMDKGEAIEHRMVTNAIEKAQRKVEGRNFDIRKQLLEFDDVANDQREVVYQQRNELLESDNISEVITDIRRDVVDEAVSGFIPPQSLEEQWNTPGLEKYLEAEFGIRPAVSKWLEEDDRLHEEGIRERIQAGFAEVYERKSAAIGTDNMQQIEKQLMLQVLDVLWKEHLANMDHLRQGINLRVYAQKNPKQEYKRESFELFQQMLNRIKFETVQFLMRVQITRQDEAEEIERRRREAQAQQQMQFQHEDISAMKDGQQAASRQPQQQPFVRQGAKIGRNDPCPCGSGKKYKQCHGKLS